MSITSWLPVKAHIHVIDDEPAILEIFHELLEDEGYTVTTESFGDRDLAASHRRIQETMPAVLVLDLLIGGEPTGWKLLQMLKMQPATAKIPVVVCTAAVRTIEGLESHLAAMGVTVVLKPFDVDQFVDAVNVALASAKGAQRPAAAPERSNPSISSGL